MEDRQSTEADVANAYRVLLGREAENAAVCEQQSGPKITRLIEKFWGSGEFAEAVIGGLNDGNGSSDRFSRAPLTRDGRWIADAFPIQQESREALGSISSWPDLYQLLLTDSRFLSALRDMSLEWQPEDLLASLPRWSAAFPHSAQAKNIVRWSGQSANSSMRAQLPIGFESEIYSRYRDARESRLGLAEHYCRIGFQQGRVYNKGMYNHRASLVKNGIDRELYLTQRPELDVDADIVEDWIFFGSINGLVPAHDFSAEYYGKRYADLANSNADLYEHFLFHGRNEGRLGQFVVDHFMQSGGKSWKLLAPTIILVSHEASRTGAPILALALMKQFSKSHNVILLLPRGGELMSEFEAECVLYGVGHLERFDGVSLINALRDRYCVEAIVINSVASGYMAEAALLADLPSVGLIHEFASYTKPVTQMIRTVEQLDVAITPASLIAEQINGEALIYRGGPALNVVIRPQGYIDPVQDEPVKADMTAENVRNALNIAAGETAAIVLGGGTVQIRKGVDLFVQTAAEIKRTAKHPVKFLWVGHGYDPENDHAYSMYIDYIVGALDLKKDIFFAPPQQNFGLIIEMADVFFVSSRQDPFPNVALDAFAADKPVVCFHGATGIAEVIGPDSFVGGVARFCDVHHAAELINQCLEGGPVNGRNRAIIDEQFTLKRYATFIFDQIEKAKAITKERKEMVHTITSEDCFDATYHETYPVDSVAGRADAVRYYVARGQKGLLWRNPRPGFNEGAALASAGRKGTPGLLIARTEQSGCPTTHLAVNLDTRTAPRKASDLKVALHLHLYYADIASEFAQLCIESKLKADIVISTFSHLGQIECDYAFRNYRGGNVTVIIVANDGRDIGPFLKQIPDNLDLTKYDVVGHLHGKRSSVLPEMGNRWRRFLIDALVGDADNYAKILDLFAESSSLGMIFAEDSHSVGWGENLPHAHEVASRMTPRPSVPAYPIFPIGTMFWARPAALEPIWTTKDLLSGLPGEPLPYDGTILHAFERLLPSVVEAQGFSWLTVHRSGKGW